MRIDRKEEPERFVERVLPDDYIESCLRKANEKKQGKQGGDKQTS